MDDLTHIPEATLAAYYDQELQPHDQHLVAQHVATCAYCRQILHDMGTVAQALNTLADVPISEAVDHKVAAALREAPKPLRVWQQRRVYGAVAAALLVACMGIWFAINPFELKDSDASSSTVQAAAFDYGLYLSALNVPTMMQRFEQQYGRQAIALEDIHTEADWAAVDWGALGGNLAIENVYLLEKTGSKSLQINYQDRGRPVTVFCQPSAYAMQFSGHPTDTINIDEQPCVGAYCGAYIAISFATDEALYAVVGARNNPRLEEIVRTLRDG